MSAAAESEWLDKLTFDLEFTENLAACRQPVADLEGTAGYAPPPFISTYGEWSATALLN